MIARNFIIRLVLGLGMCWFFVVGTLALLDGHIYELPNHMVLVKDQGVHIYQKRITAEFGVQVKFKEEETE